MYVECTHPHDPRSTMCRACFKANKPCLEEGCGNRAIARGMCETHYRRWQHHGDPSILLRPWKRTVTICSVTGCDRKPVGGTLCGMHYTRQRKYGTTEMKKGAKVYAHSEMRLWAKVDFDGPVPPHMPDAGPCWNWLGSQDGVGYGRVYLGKGRTYNAHRVSYWLQFGAIPDRLTIDHLCRNTLCVNPWHLEAVSRNENTRRMMLVRNATKHLVAPDLPPVVAT